MKERGNKGKDLDLRVTAFEIPLPSPSRQHERNCSTVVCTWTRYARRRPPPSSSPTSLSSGNAGHGKQWEHAPTTLAPAPSPSPEPQGHPIRHRRARLLLPPNTPPAGFCFPHFSKFDH